MNGSRREFLGAAALLGLSPFVARLEPMFRLQPGAEGRRTFLHGVASGDPLPDRVILWTRVTPPPTRSAIGPIQVRWQLATDERLASVVASGTTAASPDRDFTVKVDAGGLR